MGHKICEVDMRRKTRTGANTYFVRRVMPYGALSSHEPELRLKELIVPKFEAKMPKTRSPSPLTSTFREKLYLRPLNMDMVNMMTSRRRRLRRKKNELSEQ